jgi:hypothetical protein
MLEEVSQTLLVVILLNSTYIVRDVEVGQILLLVVVTKVVFHTIRQRSHADGLIRRDYGILLRSRLRSYRESNQQRDNGCK